MYQDDYFESFLTIFVLSAKLRGSLGRQLDHQEQIQLSQIGETNSKCAYNLLFKRKSVPRAKKGLETLK